MNAGSGAATHYLAGQRRFEAVGIGVADWKFAAVAELESWLKTERCLNSRSGSVI
jgi:hypothetical protein